MTSKNGKIVLLLMAVLLTIPATLFADGGGNPQPPAGEYKYVPPPYLGNGIIVQYASFCSYGSQQYTDCALLYGTLKRAGSENVQCVLNGAIWETGVQKVVFESHTAKDIQGRQLIGSYIGCPGFYEIIAAHSLFYSPDYSSFTVDLIVMEIVEKVPNK